MAESLHARVVGDDGEDFREDVRTAGSEDEGHGGAASPGVGPDSAMAESDQAMHRRHRRERVLRCCQWAGVAAFVAALVWLLRKQMG